jgi:hypothetical protein
MTSVLPIETSTRRYGFGQVAGAELIKVRSLRSTWWTLLVTMVGSLGVTILATNSVGHHRPSWYQGFDPTNQSMTGLAVATLAVGVFGVLAATGEYASGTMRATLAATPRRPVLLTAKMAVVGALALVAGEVITFACFGVGQAVLAAGGAPTATLGQAGVLRALLLSGAFVGLLGLMALGLGIVIRHTAGGIAGYAAITFLLPVLLQRIPGNPARFTPIPILANSVSAVVPQQGHVAAAEGFLLMVLYAAVVLGLAMAAFVRRDA